MTTSTNKLPHLSEANPQAYVETPLHPEKTDCLVRFMDWWNPSITMKHISKGYLRVSFLNFKTDVLNGRVRNCWEQEGTHARKPGSGASRKTTRRADRMIVRKALVDPTVTRSTIRADVGVAIVPQTIPGHLAEANLKSKRTFRALSLTPEHR
ncbi:HTH_Tnp_Tc3_2 domain-containing protein [Trichonephila clavipes]|nr:HTH_Tnp_Tc3_2 domain-containing protein [Trichonephila clavipes]